MTRTIVITFLLLIGLLSALSAQQDSTGCVDIVILRGGSEFRGTLLEYVPKKQLVLKTWSGLVLHLPANELRRVIQRCPGDQQSHKKPRETRPYTFKERGWYHATRLSFLPGQNFDSENTVGVGILHSSGWMFHRLLGVGLGLGVEMFDPYGSDAASYPLVAEARGYLKPANTTAFYTVAAGWGFVGEAESADFRNGWIEGRWYGGPVIKTQIGYRLGRHFTIFGGLALQYKRIEWNRANNMENGTDRIRNQRLELGLGVVL